ncbi:MAG: quinolinate synthase [Betaproteobacteria bacterium TMED156]|nr:MAG: quinolinate synthase [Betaproteobacteria bacterium TMED156]
MKTCNSSEKKYDFNLEKAKTIASNLSSFSNEERLEIETKIQKKLKEQDAVMVTHYYVDNQLQDLTLATGGIVSDSLEMARFGKEHPAKKLVVSGVKFMGETAKILSPNKNILMPDLGAECSLDLGCPIEEFTKFCEQNPERTVVVYANTSAQVKARADWVVTSSCAIDIVKFLKIRNEPIIFAPDRHLGQYILNNTQADMLLWDGHCVVHDEFKAFELKEMKISLQGTVEVLVHPESPSGVIDLADFVGSTSQMLEYSKASNCKKFIVATDGGLFHSMRKASPDKFFIEAPTAGSGATCKSCAYCPWMAMNSLGGVLKSLETGCGEISVPKEIISKANKSLQRMLDFTKSNVSKN